jgi:hypothetical protein
MYFIVCNQIRVNTTLTALTPDIAIQKKYITLASSWMMMMKAKDNAIHGGWSLRKHTTNVIDFKFLF